MTEKEIAEKVWALYAKEIRPHLKDGDDIPYDGTISIIEERLKKILPRPKQKVKKTEKRWILLYWDKINEEILVEGVFTYGDVKRKDRTVQEIEISVEVESDEGEE